MIYCIKCRCLMEPVLFYKDKSEGFFCVNHGFWQVGYAEGYWRYEEFYQQIHPDWRIQQ